MRIPLFCYYISYHFFINLILAGYPEDCKQRLEDCGSDVSCITKVLLECAGNYFHCTTIESKYQIANP